MLKDRCVKQFINTQLRKLQIAKTYRITNESFRLMEDVYREGVEG